MVASILVGIMQEAQSEREQAMHNALVELESMIMYAQKSLRNCLTAISVKSGFPEHEIRRSWVLLHDMTIEEFHDRMFGEEWGESKGAAPLYTEQEFEAEQQVPARIEQLESIFDCPNHKNMNINPPATEDYNYYTSEKLKLAAGWLENLAIQFGQDDPNELVKRVSDAYGLDEWDLKIEFDVRTNCDIFAYHNLFHNGKRSSIPSVAVEVEKLGDGRTLYRYNQGSDASSTSTTYFKSRWEEQATAWQRLEEMAEQARASMAEGKNVQA